MNPGRAIAALETGLGDECLLYRVEHAAVGQSFDGYHFCAVDKCRKVETARDRRAIDEHGAATAQPLSAALASSEKIEFALQHLNYCFVNRDVSRRLAAIQGESYRAPSLTHHSFSRGRFSDSRMALSTRSGVMGISIMRTPTASKSALEIAGETPNMPVSPTPLAPYGPCS